MTCDAAGSNALVTPAWNFSGVSSDSVDLPVFYSALRIRDGDLQEVVPGIVTFQQFGAGTASHYYLRGENHIYGAGVYTTLDGMPLSLDQHVVVNGYTDVNFVIPELISRVNYKKGPYDSGIQGPSSSGYIDYVVPDVMENSTVKMSMGAHQYFRTVAATSDKQLNGDLLYAVDLDRYMGPWKTAPEDKKKITTYIKQTWKSGVDTYNLSFVGYRNNWNALTPVPTRGVDSGMYTDLSTVDPTDDGKRRVVGISTRWQRKLDDALSKAQIYFVDSDFRLFTNNTYFLYDNVDGDQLEQVDRRNTYGVDYSYRLNSSLKAFPMRNTFGIQVQRNLVGQDGLYQTKNPSRLVLIRNNRDDALKVGLFWKNHIRLGQRYQGRAGVRFNEYRYDVRSNLDANSGVKKDNIFTGDIGLDYRISDGVHAYVNTGASYATNQASDVVGTIDPLTGATVKPRDIFIPVKSSEMGLIYSDARFVMSLALWEKKSTAEITLAPESNFATSGRASQRRGVEWLAKFEPFHTLSTYISATYANVRYTEQDPVTPSLGDSIPGIPRFTGKAGITYTPVSKYYYILEGKYLGSRPLDENDTSEARAFAVFNIRTGFHWKDLDLHLDILNLLNNDAPEVDYLYTSRLPAESAGGVNDAHYRIVHPRTYRLTVVHRF